MLFQSTRTVPPLRTLAFSPPGLTGLIDDLMDPSLRPPLAIISALVLALLGGCSEFTAREQPREEFARGENWTHAPSWATASIRQNWWTAYHSASLDRHVETALAHNAGLRVLGARLEQADAQARQARAAAWPTIKVGTGLVYGNEQGRMTGYRPTDLEPWASTASISWEIDLFGKLRAAIRAADDARQAAFWDLHGGRLLVASQTAEAYFRILRLNEEMSIMQNSVEANRRIVQTMRDRQGAGIISTTELRRQEAEQERLQRDLLDLERLRDLANLQLGTLRGSARPGSRPAGYLASVALPPLPARTTTAVMRKRPDLLAAEARVRSAFQLEESARLDLLPSLSLGAGAAGRSSALTSGFRSWIASVGPRLEVPIYDPQRLAAVPSRRAATNEAAALYRNTALQAFEEVEAAYLNLTNRRRQLSAAQREVAALEEARRNTRATFDAGVVSQVELLESERGTLEAQRQELALRHALLRNHLDLIRALGG